MMDLETLRGRVRGDVVTRDSADFEKTAVDGMWNQIRPSRRPDVIVRAADQDDVSAAVQYARANGLRAVVRGGGHNWCGMALRDGGVMIDLSAMNRVVSIDADARRAVLEPFLSNREVIAALAPHRLAYPTGHCPTVKMSGYLLSGGMAWNHGVWGPGVGSIEAIDLVLADGRQVTASREQNADLFWAARGAGPGLFAVAVRYHLRLYPLPRAITASAYCFSMSEVVKIAEWLGPLADSLHPKVELSLFMITAPPHLRDHGEAHGGKICMVTATVFADTAAEAEEAVRPLEGCPLMDRCVSRTFNDPTDFEHIFDASGALWPDGLRCQVDAMFSNDNLADVINTVKDHFIACPSPKSVLMYAVYTGGHAPPTPDDAAFSATGRLYGGPWTMWDSPAEDPDNIAWHKRCVALLAPHTNAHYVSETDTAGHPDFVRRSYSAENLARIEELRRKYDPDGLFYGYHDGL